MDNQPQNPPVNSQPASPPAPAPTPPPAAPTPPAPQNAMSKNKRIIISVIGAILVLFALSIVQGQVSHSFDAPGIIMILFFGGIGLVLLYQGLFAKKRQ